MKITKYPLYKQPVNITPIIKKVNAIHGLFIYPQITSNIAGSKEPTVSANFLTFSFFIFLDFINQEKNYAYPLAKMNKAKNGKTDKIPELDKLNFK